MWKIHAFQRPSVNNYVWSFYLKIRANAWAILKTGKLKHQKLMLKVPLLVSRKGSEIQVPLTSTLVMLQAGWNLSLNWGGRKGTETRLCLREEEELREILLSPCPYVHRFSQRSSTSSRFWKPKYHFIFFKELQHIPKKVWKSIVKKPAGSLPWK